MNAESRSAVRHSRAVRALLAALLLVGAGACGASDPAPPAAVADTFTFTGRTLDGESFDAAAMAGKPALLWFWAPWCATCAGQADSVNGVKDTFGDRLGILGIAGMGSNAEMHEFVTDLDVGGIRNLDDEAGVLWKRFGITEQSTYVLIDRTGRIVTTSYLDDQQLTAEVGALVA